MEGHFLVEKKYVRKIAPREISCKHAENFDAIDCQYCSIYKNAMCKLFTQLRNVCASHCIALQKFCRPQIVHAVDSESFHFICIHI